MRKFEYGDGKNEINVAKHKISFQEAQAMWERPVFEYPIKDAVKLYGEMRYLGLGEIDGRLLAAVVSYRGGTVRLISVRDSNQKEREQYASEIEKAKQAAKAKELRI